MNRSSRSARSLLAALVGAAAALVVVSIVVVAAGASDPASGPTPTLQTTSVSPPSGPDVPVVVAAGDIACDPESSAFNGGVGTEASCQQMATSDLALGLDPDAVFLLGDLQYECGGYEAFLESFDPSWGRLQAVTYPAPGNHEYNTSGGTGCSPDADAAGYFKYFGDRAGDPDEGWYSFEVGTWHAIALNSNCGEVGGCDADSPQGQWLAADLAASDATCTVAYWHHARFSSGEHGNDEAMAEVWEVLHREGVDLVLAGHDHDYEPFAPLDAEQQLDPQGIRSFVVGTGGKTLRSFPGVESGSEARFNETFGVLRLTLGEGAFGWEFLPISGGGPVDEGSGACH